MIEAASAFIRREMLDEARDALRSARAALAVRSDVGPAHWCDACLVALEIAARDGDAPALAAEAAQLRALSGGRRYWTEQARARIAGCAGRIDPAHLDHVFAVLAGEPAARVTHVQCPADEPTNLIAAECPGAQQSGPLPAETLYSTDLREEPSTCRVESSQDAADDLRSIAEGQSYSAGVADAPLADSLPASRGARETELPDVPPLELASSRRIVPRVQMLVFPGLHSASATRHRRRVVPHGRGIVAVLALGLVLWVHRSTGDQGGSPGSTPEHERLSRGAPSAFAAASLGREDRHGIPRNHLLHGQALLAAGDTTGAVAALSAAAQSDSRGTAAWAAAEILARLPGRSATAADAYLLAFAAGLPADHAETVARAQEMAGRPDRARRVREQAAGP
ncbi:MAG TPA: hypothetical protein VF613_17385 [Longimicrobium sp.]